MIQNKLEDETKNEKIVENKNRKRNKSRSKNERLIVGTKIPKQNGK